MFARVAGSHVVDGTPAIEHLFFTLESVVKVLPVIVDAKVGFISTMIQRYVAIGLIQTGFFDARFRAGFDGFGWFWNLRCGFDCGIVAARATTLLFVTHFLERILQ